MVEMLVDWGSLLNIETYDKINIISNDCSFKDAKIYIFDSQWCPENIFPIKTYIFKSLYLWNLME